MPINEFFDKSILFVYSLIGFNITTAIIFIIFSAYIALMFSKKRLLHTKVFDTIILILVVIGFIYSCTCEVDIDKYEQVSSLECQSEHYDVYSKYNDFMFDEKISKIEYSFIKKEWNKCNRELTRTINH